MKLCIHLHKSRKGGNARTPSCTSTYIIKVPISKGKMMMNQKTFRFNHEWTTIFYPERPSGFSILLVGGERHYIHEKTNFWMEHPGKRQMVDHLLGKGYTLFATNLGAHWGKEGASDTLAELYAHFIRHEIVNDKIHLLAEGTGALLLESLCMHLDGKIRSIAMVDPELSLLKRYEKEKENKFFHKKFMKEISHAYNMETADAANWLKGRHDCRIPEEIPVLLMHVINSYEKNLKAHYQHIASTHPHFDINYITPEKRYSIPYQMNSFFKRHEKQL